MDSAEQQFHSVRSTAAESSRTLMDSGEQQFHSVRSTAAESSRTLMDSGGGDHHRRHRRGGHLLSEDEDETLADSVVDSMHSCLQVCLGGGGAT